MTQKVMVNFYNLHQHSSGRFKPIFLLQDLQRRSIPDALMRSRMVIRHFPQAVLIPAIFRAGEPEDMNAFFMIGAMTPFDNPILPGRPRLDRPMTNAQGVGHLSKGGSSFRMGRLPHREGHRVIGHDENKGGNRSHARRTTAATVAD